ncbi:MAG: YchF/TatD family DNA exonuclease [Candidatus Schekmanbacteria bacterium]|nr:MAG: YchF/TatD family DNA exonuclease [Candidatus Schekmanbacteria bacterium]
MIIETHSHLSFPDFKDDLPDVLKRAREKGVEVIITVSADILSTRENAKIAKQEERVFFTPGIHPHDTDNAKEEYFREIEEILKRDKLAVAVGETGLDFYRNHSTRKRQEESFIRFIDIAKRLNKPLVIHCRDAYSRLSEIIESEEAGIAGGVVHCFSGDYNFARTILDNGFFIGVGGTITYPKSNAIREVIKRVPMERIVLETDCPYLAPQAVRGKRNEPSFLTYIIDEIALLKGLSNSDVARVTSLNASTLFSLGVVNPQSVITYRIRDSLYVNVTNRCSNKCVFCRREEDPIVKGHLLKLGEEPSAERIIEEIGNPKNYDEIVFCGYGEPLIRLAIVKEVAKWVKAKGGKVRINTNGQANLIHKRNIIPELEGLVDRISISLNAHNAEVYEKLCPSEFGPKAYEEIIKFAKEAKRFIPDVTLTVVSLEEVDIEKCKNIAESVGANFRIREYNVVG